MWCPFTFIVENHLYQKCRIMERKESYLLQKYEFHSNLTFLNEWCRVRSLSSMVPYLWAMTLCYVADDTIPNCNHFPPPCYRKYNVTTGSFFLPQVYKQYIFHEKEKTVQKNSPWHPAKGQPRRTCPTAMHGDLKGTRDKHSFRFSSANKTLRGIFSV